MCLPEMTNRIQGHLANGTEFKVSRIDRLESTSHWRTEQRLMFEYEGLLTEGSYEGED